MHHDRMSGRESRRSVSAVGAQSTTIDVPKPRLEVVTQVAESEHLVETGHDRQLLGLDGLHAGPVEERRQVGADLGPRRFEPRLRVELLARQRGRRSRSAARRAARRMRRPASAPDRSTARACAARQSAQRRAVAAADVVLPTPPLPVSSRTRATTARLGLSAPTACARCAPRRGASRSRAAARRLRCSGRT